MGQEPSLIRFALLFFWTIIVFTGVYTYLAIAAKNLFKNMNELHMGLLYGMAVMANAVLPEPTDLPALAATGVSTLTGVVLGFALFFLRLHGSPFQLREVRILVPAMVGPGNYTDGKPSRVERFNRFLARRSPIVKKAMVALFLNLLILIPLNTTAAVSAVTIITVMTSLEWVLERMHPRGLR